MKILQRILGECDRQVKEFCPYIELYDVLANPKITNTSLMPEPPSENRKDRIFQSEDSVVR